jgi:predicted RNase H-like nuclease (RuvC/YqgF family)
MAEELTEEQRLKRNARRRDYYERHKAFSNGGAVHSRQRFQTIPENIERLDICRNGKTVKRYKNEIAGMSWSDFEERLPSDGIPGGKYNYSMKLQDKPEIFNGIIKSVDQKMDESKEITEVKKTIEDLNKNFKTLMTKGGSDQVTVEFMIQAAERSHQAEIKFYELQIKIKDETIFELKGTIKELEAELDKAEEIVEKLKEESGSGKTAETIMGLVNRFVPAQSQQKIKLSEKFDGSDIPEDIIATLAVVDYAKIPPGKLSELKNGLRMIVHQLPQKAA